MGYQLEYFVELPPEPAREWLSQLPGSWVEPFEDYVLGGEFEWGGRALHVDLGAAACSLRVPEIKYSWLIHEHAASLDWVAQFESWLGQTLPRTRVVRLDELVRQKWEAVAGEWLAVSNPAETLWHWLPLNESDSAYYRLFVTS